MHDYDFQTKTSTNTSMKSAGTQAQPSKRVVQNILDFARSVQRVNVENIQIKLYLN